MYDKNHNLFSQVCLAVGEQGINERAKNQENNKGYKVLYNS